MLENNHNRHERRVRISPEDAQVTRDRWLRVQQGVYNAYLGVNALDATVANSPIYSDHTALANGAIAASMESTSMSDMAASREESLELGIADNAVSDAFLTEAATEDRKSVV